jgi:predicted transglutaminase-like cysteine proteinase
MKLSNFAQNPPTLIKRIGSVLLIGIPAAMALAVAVPDLREAARQQWGVETEQTVIEWQSMIEAARFAPLPERLERANRFFNERVEWVEDPQAWGSEDYWATPLESMGNQRGDCEDFAIAKYITLLTMGVDPDSLRLIYVKAKRSGLTRAHMVLAWYESPTQPPLILDNIDRAILPATQRGDLLPVFSFNANSLWVGSKTTPSSANPVNRLSRWRNVLNKLRNEGFALEF